MGDFICRRSGPACRPVGRFLHNGVCERRFVRSRDDFDCHRLLPDRHPRPEFRQQSAGERAASDRRPADIHGLEPRRGYYWFLGFLVVLPSFLTMRKISFRLRGVYLDALLKARDVSVLADRFDTALNNMPHGLAMLGNHGRVVVTNQRLLDLLKLQPSFSDKKATIEELLHHSAEAGGVCKDEISEVLDGLHLRIGGEAFEELLLQTTNGRTLDLTLQPMSNGGAVVLFEDVTERRITQARINELARFDSLTGLPNRTEFHERAEDILSSPSSSCAMMFVDLD